MPEFQSLTVMIKVPDIRAAIDFNIAIGFALEGTDEFHYGEGQVNGAMLRNGGAALMLSVGGDDRPKPGQEFFLRADDADAYHAAIADKVTVTHAPRDQFYGMRDFWFTDPFGYRWGAGHPLETDG